MSWRANPAVRWLARAVCWVFYRIDQIGTVPPGGPVLLLPNHPNSLLDPALVWAMAGRDVRFLAKSTLFETSLRPILVASGAIPVYRRADEGADTSRNAEMFTAVAAALADGDAVCVFPEGLSHSSGYLEPLRTGAARITLSAERGGTTVTLVPVGLNFDRKTSFRSRVTIVFGHPFSAHDLLAGGAEPDPSAVRALTDRIAAHIRRLIVEADPDGDAALVDRVDRLYSAARARPSDPAERLTRRRTIAGGIERLREVDPAKYEQLAMQLRRYDERLRRFGLRDRHLDWQVSAGDAVIFAVREIALGLVLLPLCAAGLVLFFVPYQLTGLVARRVARGHDIIATAQVFAGAAIYAAWVAIIAALIWMLAGRTAAIVAALMTPLLAVAGLFAIERETAVLDAVRAWWLLGRARRDTWERMRRRRSELADLLDEVNTWLDSNHARTGEPA